MTRAQGLVRTLAAAHSFGLRDAEAGRIRLTTALRPSTLARRSALRAGVGDLNDVTANAWGHRARDSYDAGYAAGAAAVAS